MGKEVTIPLKDLRSLVKLLTGCAVEADAQRLLRASRPKEQRPYIREYADAVLGFAPEARRRQRVRFEELLASLRSGQDVPVALASFLDREAKASTSSQTKVRRPK